MSLPGPLRARVRASVPLLGLLIAWVEAPDAVAATFAVNSPADVPDATPGDGVCRTAPNNTVCTLRGAIMEANALAGADTINLQANTTYLLSRPGIEEAGLNADLDVFDSLTLVGAGPRSTIIDGNGLATGDRVMEIFPCIAKTPPIRPCPNGTDVVVTISGVALQHGAMQAGAGIYSTGRLTLEHCAILDNFAPQALGGGLFLQNTRTTIRGTTISGNSGYQGGGVALIDNSIVDDSRLDLINSTISLNLSAGDGGGLYAENVSIGLYNVTIANNLANFDDLDVGVGGGIAEYTSDVTLNNSIVSGNLHGNEGSQFESFDDCAGSFISASNNIVSEVDAAQCTVSPPYSSANPLLGLLQNNGGPTSTHALLIGSPAIDAGNPSGCTDNLGAFLVKDQRGEPRPVGAACDLGAFELGEGIFKDGFE